MANGCRWPRLFRVRPTSYSFFALCSSSLMSSLMFSSWLDMRLWSCFCFRMLDRLVRLHSNVRHTTYAFHAHATTPSHRPPTQNSNQKQHPSHNRSRTPTNPPRSLRRNNQTHNLPLQTTPLFRFSRLDGPRLGSSSAFAHDLCAVRCVEVEGGVDRTYGCGLGFGVGEG